MIMPNGPITLRDWIGVAIFVLTAPILAGIYWHGDWRWLSSLPAWKVALLSAVGGALGFAVVAESTRTRLVGLLSGAVSGFGCSYLNHLVYGNSFHAGKERIFVLLAGMVPGLLLGWWLLRYFEKRLFRKSCG